MAPHRRRVVAALAAAAVGAGFEIWITLPVLDRFSLAQWRGAALVTAALMAGVFSRWNGSAGSLAIAAASGVLLGGAHANLTQPNDVPISFGDAAVFAVREFWREAMVAAAMFALVCTVSATRGRG